MYVVILNYSTSILQFTADRISLGCRDYLLPGEMVAGPFLPQRTLPRLQVCPGGPANAQQAYLRAGSE